MMPYNWMAILSSPILFQLEDSSFLLIPLNPFGNSILVKDKSLIENWEETNKFPITEKFNQFYYDNELVIKNLPIHMERLKKDLYNYVYKSPSNYPDSLNKQVIDEIHKHLKSKRKVEKFRLNFIVLVGDFGG